MRLFSISERTLAGAVFISRTSDGREVAAESVGSKRFEERWIKDDAGNVIGIDARARSDRGGFWRTAVFFGRVVANYMLERGKNPVTLDEIINSACSESVPRS